MHNLIPEIYSLVSSTTSWRSKFLLRSTIRNVSHPSTGNQKVYKLSAFYVLSFISSKTAHRNKNCIGYKTFIAFSAVNVLPNFIVGFVIAGIANFKAALPNVVVNRLPLLFRNREVPSSNTDLQTHYPSRGFSWFSSAASSKCWDCTSKHIATVSF
jgi:hypothetical protein